MTLHSGQKPGIKKRAVVGGGYYFHSRSTVSHCLVIHVTFAAQPPELALLRVGPGSLGEAGPNSEKGGAEGEA